MSDIFETTYTIAENMAPLWHPSDSPDATNTIPNSTNNNHRRLINEELPDSKDFCSLNGTEYSPVSTESTTEAIAVAVSVQKAEIKKNNKILNAKDKTNGTAKAIAVAAQRANVSRRLLLALRSTKATVVCPISGIVSQMDLPVIPGAALELEHPLSILGNARGIAQQGISYLRKLDTQVLAGIFIVLAEHYSLIKFQPFDSGAQKNAILRTAGKDGLIAAIIMVEDTVHSGNFRFLPSISLVMDSEVAANGVFVRFQAYLLKLAEAIAKPDKIAYDERAKPKKIGRPVYIRDVQKNENKISYLARQEIAKAKAEFKEDKKIIKATVLALYADARISVKMKNFFMSIASDDSLLTLPEESLGLLLMKISGTMGMEPVADIIKKDRTILTIDISEVEEMFETKESEPKAHEVCDDNGANDSNVPNGNDEPEDNDNDEDGETDEEDNEVEDRELEESYQESIDIEQAHIEQAQNEAMPNNLSWIEQVIWKKQHSAPVKRNIVQTSLASLVTYTPSKEKRKMGEA